jgi:uncharacterized protein
VITAVLDTNTIVSATISSLGPSERIWQAAQDHEFVLATSEWIIGEVRRALSRDRIARKYNISRERADGVELYLRDQAILVAITREVHGVATHPEDDLVLATALSAGADYLVTGDSKLQAIGAYGGITVASPREFLDILRAEPK